MKQHKWHKEIKAWADGAEIYGKPTHETDWQLTPNPWWNRNDWEYRIKSEPKEPTYLYVYGYSDQIKLWYAKTGADGYLGKIKLEQDDE